MITSINDYKKINESLSKERERAAKLETLIKLGREMIDAYKKVDEIKELKKVKDDNIQELLTKLNETSIIAKGTLIEVIKPFKQNRLSSSAYFSFVENSVNVISADFKSISDEIKMAANKMSTASTTLRKTNNAKNKVTGEMTAEGLKDVWAGVVKVLSGWMSKFGSLLNKTQKHLESINTKAAKFLTVTESLTVTEGFVDNIFIADLYDDDQEIIMRQIIQKLELKFDTINMQEVFQTIASLSFDLITLNINIDDNFYKFVEMTNLNSAVVKDNIDIVIKNNTSMFLRDESILNEELTEDDRLARNKYSREYKQRQRNIVSVLEQAKETIVLAEESEYYTQLAKTNEKMIINLLKEFKSKSIAIDDKIISLVNTAASDKFDFSIYQEKITNAEEVGDAVALMAKALLDVHRNVVEMSGSVRQYKDDTASQDGTMGASFDYVNKTVKLPEGKTNEGKEFNYMLLSRLQSDCEYFLGYGNRRENALHQGGVEGQISKMKELWNGFPVDEKPEWLTMEQIEEYETKMLQENTNEGIGSWMKIWSKVKAFFSNFKTASQQVDVALNNI
jgi:hypothetical protein